MKKLSFILSVILISGFTRLFSQPGNDTTVYLITCDPGTETYSIYGHSALRVAVPSLREDKVYNWGVFDFNTPNFAWKFAKGRLNYKLAADQLYSFLQIYMYESRSVYSQIINLSPAEKKNLLELISENLKPQNVYYRYDFFYDDCSTRIRDLIEKAVGSKLIYPPEDKKNQLSFRQKVGQYQQMYPWLKMGIDLIMGFPGEKKASFRDRMFLPIDLQANLEQAVISRDSKMIPLLQTPEVILLFEPPEIRQHFYTTPVFIFTLLFILIVFISARLRKSPVIRYVDLILFTLFSALSILMIFFNFFTDHQQMKMNLNIIWFNPFIILALIHLIFRKEGLIWFRITFFLSLIFVPVIFFLPLAFNSSFLPIVLILALRSSARCNFQWNPMSVEPVAPK
jgi:hypothetical protein